MKTPDIEPLLLEDLAHYWAAQDGVLNWDSLSDQRQDEYRAQAQKFWNRAKKVWEVCSNCSPHPRHNGVCGTYNTTDIRDDVGLFHKPSYEERTLITGICQCQGDV